MGARPSLQRLSGSYGADVLLTISGKAVFATLGAALIVITARALGPSGQGTFAVALNLTLILIQIGSLGLTLSSPYFAAREAHLHRALAFVLIRIATTCGVVLCALAALLKALFPGLLPGLDWSDLAITLAAVPGAIAATYLQAMLLGQQRMLPYNLMDTAQVGTSVAALVCLVAVSNVTLTGVLVISSAGRYAGLAVGVWALRHVLVSDAPTTYPGLLSRLFARSVRIYVVSLLAFVLIRLDLLLVNAVLGSEDAGRYSVAGYVTEALILVPTVVSNVMLPRLARSADGQMTAAAFRAITAVWSVICIGTVPIVWFAIPLVFGPAYRDSSLLYALLAPGTFCLGMLSVLMAQFVVTGYPRALLFAWLLGLGLNVAMNLVILPIVGVVAAPIISSVTYAAVLVLHLRVFAQSTGGYRPLAPRPTELPTLVRAAFGR